MEREAMIRVTLQREGGETEHDLLEFGLPAVIGRSKLADVTLLHSLISRRHCELTETGDGRLAARDLESLNGTFVEEARIKRTILQPGDRISFGPFTFRVDYTPAVAASKNAGIESPAETSDTAATHDRETIPAVRPVEGDPVPRQAAPSPDELRFLEQNDTTTNYGPTDVPRLGEASPDPVKPQDEALQDFLKKIT